MLGTRSAAALCGVVGLFLIAAGLQDGGDATVAGAILVGSGLIVSAIFDVGRRAPADERR